MAHIFMPRLFKNLPQKLRGVRLEIVTAQTKNIFNDLHEERFDVGVAIESDPECVPAGIVFERLTEVANGADRPSKPSSLARSRKPVDIGLLASEPIIMSELTVGYSQVVLSPFADLGIRPNILAIADNIETMKAIVQSGTGIAIVPRASAIHRAIVRRGAITSHPVLGGLHHHYVRV